MKKCIMCEVIFDNDERKKCLYCNRFLVSADESDVEKFKKEDIKAKKTEFNIKSAFAKIVEDRRGDELKHKEYVMENYFKTRTFSFLYFFCRNEFAMGQEYKRSFIQPISMSSFFILPWVFINLIDTALFKLRYKRFCAKCGWKYKGRHSKKKCDYNLEYETLINDIMTGRITKNEKEYKRSSLEKEKMGQVNAYSQLCADKTRESVFNDVSCICLSIILIAVTVIYVFYPMMKFFVAIDLGMEGLDFR